MSRRYKDLLYDEGDTISLPKRKHFPDSPVIQGRRRTKGRVFQVRHHSKDKYPIASNPGGDVCPWELLPYE